MKFDHVFQKDTYFFLSTRHQVFEVLSILFFECSTEFDQAMTFSFCLFSSTIAFNQSSFKKKYTWTKKKQRIRSILQEQV